MEEKEQEKIVKLCEKLNTLLDKTILEGYSHLQQITNRRLQREKRDLTKWRYRRWGNGRWGDVWYRINQ